MSSQELPVVLINAVNLTAAKSIMSELIDNEVEQTDSDDNENSRIWRLVNKYYTMDVRVQPLVDRDDYVPDNFEAHIIYLTADECGAEAEAKVAATAGARRDTVGGRAPLRLAAADCSEPPAALEHWAIAARYELVALRESAPADPPPPGPFAESFGVERLRSSLHAHVWPALRARAARPVSPLSSDGSDSGDDDDDHDDEDEDEDDEGAVEHAERFAAALEALEALARAPPAADGPARAARAEAALAAFCRALGPRAPPDLAALAALPALPALPPDRW